MGVHGPRPLPRTAREPRAGRQDEYQIGSQPPHARGLEEAAEVAHPAEGVQRELEVGAEEEPAPGLERVVFLAGFSAGSTAAMALLTAGLARAVRAPRLAALLPRIPRWASAASIAIGLGWIAAA